MSTSDCTGALVLGAAGLCAATSHRALVIRDLLPLLGATRVNERVVQDRNRITGGGVTAGIDFGLTLALLLRSREEAEWVQLVIEYAPAPPPYRRRHPRGLRTPDACPAPAISAVREKAA